MYDNKRLGNTLRELRINRHMSLKDAAGADMSLSQLSRFERGESDISLCKFLSVIDRLQIEVKEFMDAAMDYQKTEHIKLMSSLIELEYERDIKGFKRLQDEERKKLEEDPQNIRRRLNIILLQGFICKCDESVEFPKEYLDEVTDYLFHTENWNIYELILIGNLYLFIDIPLLHEMGKEIVKRKKFYKEIGTHKNLVIITLMNIWEVCIHKDELETALFYQKEVYKLIENETRLYEKTIYLFLTGLCAYKQKDVLGGIEDMKNAIGIFEMLGCINMAKNYKNDFEKYVK